MTSEMDGQPQATPRWAWVGLAFVLLVDVWLRGHALGPTFSDALGVPLYPVTGASATPLDCDEGIYGYIGDRLGRGDVMYRDLTENKPPGGYWLYMLAVQFGGMTERTIRLMPIPMVLLTIALVWRLALRLCGPGAAVLAAAIYAIVSTDPYTYADGAQMEIPLNLFATAALVCFVEARGHRLWLFVAGLCVGLAVLVKQIAALHGLMFVVALIFLTGTAKRERGRSSVHRLVSFWVPRVPRNPCAKAEADRARVGDNPWHPESVDRRGTSLFVLVAGALAPLLIAALVLLAQGAGPQAYQDIFVYGRALATQTPSPPNAPSALVRWVTGNADPAGALPWPFGKSTYLAWWGTGTWPVWLAAVPALFWLSFGPRANAISRTVVAWTLSSVIQVVLPGLYWPHYYQLPMPGLAGAIAVFLADMIFGVKTNPSLWKRSICLIVSLVLAGAIAETARIQVRDYLLVPADRLVNVKGGPQWIALRGLGGELARRSVAFERPSLFVWGWQGSLYFYSGYAHVTPQVFVDDFLKSFAASANPVARPRVERTIRDLRARPPSAIFVAYPPFPELEAFLRERYRPSRLSPGLWIIRERHEEFEAFGQPWNR
jgi:4-amino-4-deoxy-L-arabinose transferase-like glycosyltransferase